MSLEDRVRTAVDAALEDLRTRVEGEMRELVDQLVTAAIQDRAEAVNLARRQAFDEAWQGARREAAERNARAQDIADRAIAEARADERAAAERRLQEALGNAELRFVQQHREAEQEAACRLEEARAAAQEVAVAVQRQASLLDGIRGLDAATTLSDVLNALVVSISREAARAAVLIVRGERLVGWKLSGFGPRDLDPKTVDINLRDAGLTGRAVVEAGPVTSAGGSSTGVLIDEPTGTDALAVPILVGGRVVAVVYASQPAATARVTGWHDGVEMLVRHGGRCLEALTVQKAVRPAAPRFWVPTRRSPEAPVEHEPAPVAPNSRIQ